MRGYQKYSFRNLAVATSFLWLFAAQVAWSQKVTKVTITDQLSAASALSYGTPKPAAAKDKFVLAGDKGAKVLVYLSLEPDSMMQPGFGFKYTVNRSQDGKEEWIDERLLALKPTARYSMAAFTLTEPGRYHFLVTDQQDERKVYAEGWATVVQE